MKITIPEEISPSFIYACMGFGQKEPDPDSLKLIQTCSRLVLDTAVPHAVCQEFPLRFTEDLGEAYVIHPKNKLAGSAVAKHLAGCESCILMAVTLGVQMDRLIRRAQVTDMAKAVALDACASSLIEDLCDQLQLRMTEAYHKKGMALTARFSPGYGDLPLEAQDVFSNLLNMERKIGLTKSSEHLLIPRKSVTAVIGILPEEKARDSRKGGTGRKNEKAQTACETCERRDSCLFRINGGYCGRR
ncbi:hypothetical protein EQM06_02400 [Aminipila luticellarii]|uniref:Vitamin B12 dependent methionine synthase, activation domain n=2 Tax=Aminipila luticellarii TaxID=2507160 RepID=A0A410PTD7_9FIRM|nr:hypothetical protein EQM06_02400 [Aminipila luticellarii]